VLFHEYFDGDTGRGLGPAVLAWAPQHTLCIDIGGTGIKANVYDALGLDRLGGLKLWA
jgi:hypothetical protein